MSNWQERREDDKQRYTDYNYSDLFGRKFDHPKTTNEPLIPSSADWKDSRFEEKQRYVAGYIGDEIKPETVEARLPERVYAIDAKQYKQQSLCTRQFEDLPRPEDFAVEALEVSGISDAVKLKKALEGCHVIQLDQNYDSITGRTSSTAKVTLRSHEGTEAVQTKLRMAGFQCRALASSSARRSKYNDLSNSSFLDPRTEDAGARENSGSADWRKRSQATQSKVVGSVYTSERATKAQQWEPVRKNKARGQRPFSDNLRA
jgi:hypothetical protein